MTHSKMHRSGSFGCGYDLLALKEELSTGGWGHSSTRYAGMLARFTQDEPIFPEILDALIENANGNEKWHLRRLYDGGTTKTNDRFWRSAAEDPGHGCIRFGNGRFVGIGRYVMTGGTRCLPDIMWVVDLWSARVVNL